MNINNFVQKDETPTLIDTSTPGIIYMGYPLRESSATSAAEWAIRKIVFTAGTTGGVYQPKLWANRTTEKISIWDNRKAFPIGTYEVVLGDNTTDWLKFIGVSTLDTSDSPSSSGGGVSLNADYKSPTDFTATNTGSYTIALSNLPISIIDDSQFSYVKIINTTWNLTRIYYNAVDNIRMTYSAGILTVNNIPVILDGDDIYEVGINSQKKGYDSSTQSLLVSTLNPEYAHNTDIETTTYASTGDTTAFNQVIYMQDFKNMYLQLVGTNIDFTVEATGDGTNWDDVSTIVLGAASFSTTTAASDSYFIDTPMMPYAFRVVCTPTNASNATTINIRRY